MTGYATTADLARAYGCDHEMAIAIQGRSSPLARAIAILGPVRAHYDRQRMGWTLDQVPARDAEIIQAGLIVMQTPAPAGTEVRAIKSARDDAIAGVSSLTSPGAPASGSFPEGSK